ncbi:MAG: MurR/RpiR family transcriptional regulator [Chloroflexi bacterium]|nr:MurR/RpiR family transcriptional regulator [Chloroflexota bacterium]
MGSAAPLENRITTVFPTLSHAHQKLARLILDNGLFVAFASAAELGKQVGVSNATVVRFCQTLGYDGYPELQAAVRANLPTYVHKVQQIERKSARVRTENLLQRVFEIDAQNLSDTLAALDQARFWAATRAITRASDILVVAGGLSAGPALYLAHSLNVMGFDARAALNGGIPLTLELTRVKASSVLIGISVWRYVADTVAAMEHARRIGATRIAISDSAVAPIAQHAAFAFQVATNGAAHSLSLTSMLALINAFVAALSFTRPKQTARALRKIDAAYRRGKLVLE